jgi:hypothetical protein
MYSITGSGCEMTMEIGFGWEVWMAMRSQSRNVNKHHGYYMNISRGRDYMGYKVSGENYLEYYRPWLRNNNGN